MRLKKHERVAIEAVARRFSATWEVGSDAAAAHIRFGGRRVEVDIATLNRRGPGQRNTAKLRLRFDKAVTRLIGHLQAALVETVPDGMTVLLTVTAPIRLRSKTAASLEDKIQALLKRGSPGRDTKETIHGNHVRIRLSKAPGRAPKLIGFVHNPDSDPLLLLSMTREWLELISAWTGKRLSKLADDRWLVVISAGGMSRLEAYRYISSQLPVPTAYKKVFMVFGDGRVGTLTG